MKYLKLYEDIDWDDFDEEEFKDSYTEKYYLISTFNNILTLRKIKIINDNRRIDFYKYINVYTNILIYEDIYITDLLNDLSLNGEDGIFLFKLSDEDKMKDLYMKLTGKSINVKNIEKWGEITGEKKDFI